jgi:hypothetical protein
VNLALEMLQADLRSHGLELGDIALENTVFRVVGQDEHYLTLELLHVWSAGIDPLPKQENGYLHFSPAFSTRQQKISTEQFAQQESLQLLQRAVEELPANTPFLRQALALDSGKALDELFFATTRSFTNDNLAVEVNRVLQDAAAYVDPILTFKLEEKFEKCELIKDVFQLVEECEKASKTNKDIPDFLAWELFLTGFALKSYLPSTYSGIVTTISGSIGKVNIQDLAKETPWRIIRELVENGPNSRLLGSIIKSQWNDHLIKLIESNYQRLKKYYPIYLEACFNSLGFPSRSEQIRERLAPDCLSRRDQVFYNIMLGDYAAYFSRLIQASFDTYNQRSLTQLLKVLKHLHIPANFENLNHLRRQLLDDLERYSKVDDVVSLKIGAANLLEMKIRAFYLAENSYLEAAWNDKESGCAWLRLAHLKWQTNHFREALQILIGPSRELDLKACQLPLSVAVRALGGRLAFKKGIEASTQSAPKSATIPRVWRELEELELEISLEEEGVLRLKCSQGEAIIEGLGMEDILVLTRFFHNYRPQTLRSSGVDSFEDWLSLVKVPNLGLRARLKEGLNEETEFALLVACYYLGLPEFITDSLVTKIGVPRQERTYVLSELRWG